MGSLADRLLAKEQERVVEEWSLGSLAAARVSIKRCLRKEQTKAGRRNLEHTYRMLQQIKRQKFGILSVHP